jgi:hypothetical protein
MDAGRVTSVGRYKGPEGWLYGCTDEDSFVQAKENAEILPVQRPKATRQLGGVFQDSEMRTEWTHCPVTGDIRRATITTMGVADFMECPVCNRAHFLGVNPKMKDRRLYAWQVDPLVNAEDYADVITTLYMGGKSALMRANKRHYVGLWFRSSWDEDPMENLRKRGLLKGPNIRKGARRDGSRDRTVVRGRFRNQSNARPRAGNHR